MGVSTDAKLVYGIKLAGEDCPEFLEGYGGYGFRDFIADKIGKEAIRNYPVDVVAHCSDRYPMFFLAVNRLESLYSNTFEIVASRGYPQDVTKLPVPTEEEIAALKQFIAEYNVETTGEIGWHLMSYTG